ncbi:hypothetical protein [Fulvivirga lutimaris]|uniref:hypothetical protein n=1 Tax=Fulvivirga lutimaris TaxID=1819566 RepID=UPI0031B5AB17
MNKRFTIILASIPVLLLIPLVAMQLTSEVNWTILDFAVMGILLLCTGLACEFTLRKFQKFEQRLGICLAILLAFLIIWAELAVGIF